MTDMTFSSIRSDTLARETAEKRLQQRRRSLLVLTLHFLRSEGFSGAAEALLADCPPSIGQFLPCDNVDLDVLLQDYEAYYQVRYGRAPRLIRREAGGGEPAAAEPRRRPRGRPRAAGDNAAPATANGTSSTTNGTSATSNGTSATSSGTSAATNGTSAALKGTSAAGAVSQDWTLQGRELGRGAGRDAVEDEEDPGERPRRRTLKLPGAAPPELQALAALVSRDLYLDDPGVRWEDIVGLESAKRVVREAVVYPLRYPRLFAGPLVTPWRALLLFGPPGNGKTMLAKAVAAECRTTFFNVSAATLVSKWHGDSEKLVRVLFELARAHAPATVFLDELDALMGRRGGAAEHEASRRLKTELLVQLDGLARGPQPVFVLAASNLPWELDAALLRRLEKRVLVGLPSAAEREAVFERCLRGWPVSAELSLPQLAAATGGYSAADIRLVCREAAMDSLRAVLRRLEGEAEREAWGEDRVRTQPLGQDDLLAAVRRCRPTGGQHWEQYSRWMDKYGAE